MLYFSALGNYERRIGITVPMEKLLSRCSRFSGFDLRYEVKRGVLTFFDQRNRPQLAVSLYFPDGAMLREVYGRLRQWAITPSEEAVMARLLRDSEDDAAA